MGGADNLIDPSNLRKLIERKIPFANLEDAPIPVHVVATNLGGAAICLSSGAAVEALLASAAIPAAFPSVRIGEHHLIDGAVGCNTPILNAADLGATRIIVLPTGFACALHEPPREQSRALCMRSRCLSPIKWYAISESLAGKSMFSPYPICARLMSLLTISLVPTN
jgi:predicted acylesterase/phospholipase RssA